MALFATLGTWALTALGSATVFFFKRVNDRLLNVMLSSAAGIMMAASYFSLLAPARELAGDNAWIPLCGGFILGAGFIIASDTLLDCLPRSRSTLLVTAITLHNIPEGLAVGIAFGALKEQGLSHSSILGAFSIALAIGLQNFPEGAAVSVPMRRDGASCGKSFFFGQLSGAVEPLFGVLGAALISFFTPLMPLALSFAAGAMIFVVVKELIPEAEKSGCRATSAGCIIGFALMMLLDVALG